MEKRKKADERAWIEQIIAETEADFAARQEERAALEKQWELNMQFLIGNQYAEVSSRGEIVERDDAFLWQERVFNHIAPLVESRAAKFSRVRPKLAVTPLSDDDDEITNARLAGRVVETAFEKADFDAVASEVTRWSEVCGTGFYKIVWDAEAGKKVGVTEDGDIFEGGRSALRDLPGQPLCGSRRGAQSHSRALRRRGGGVSPLRQARRRRRRGGLRRRDGKRRRPGTTR